MALWGGRFAGPMDALMKRFNDSIAFDRRMYAADIRGSIAYAGALVQTGLITPEEHDQLVAGLAQVRAEFDAGDFQVKSGDEDIHSAVERRLGEITGPVAGKLHTGRSRNDQVATDLRLYLQQEMSALQGELIKVQEAIIEKATTHLDAIMPGYTHMQVAMPSSFGLWFGAYAEALSDDLVFMQGIHALVNQNPLGSAAGFGSSFSGLRNFSSSESDESKASHHYPASSHSHLWPDI